MWEPRWSSRTTRPTTSRRLGDWLTEAGLELTVLRPHAGDALPENLDELRSRWSCSAATRAPIPAPPARPGAPWFPALEGLLRKAVRNRVPTLAVCLGGQLLATAHGGAGRAQHLRPGDRARPGRPGATPPTPTRCSSTCRCSRT